METNKNKVVVIGGAGFIGSHIVDELVVKGHEVHVIDNLSAGKKEYVNKKATLHVLDIVNIEDIKPVIRGADTVFHLAALPRVQYSIENPIETNDINVGGMLNVLVAASDGKVRRVVYSASSSAYGDKKELPISEDMDTHPLSPYALQKYVGELQCRMFSDVYNLETVSLRYFNIYGDRMDPEGAYALVIAKFLEQRKNGEHLTITGDGKQTRDFTHVRDVVRANILAMESDKVGKGEVFNIGNGKECSINNLAKMIGGEIKYISARLEPHDTRADIKKAKDMLGWEPSISLEEGIEELKVKYANN